MERIDAECAGVAVEVGWFMTPLPVSEHRIEHRREHTGVRAWEVISGSSYWDRVRRG